MKNSTMFKIISIVLAIITSISFLLFCGSFFSENDSDTSINTNTSETSDSITSKDSVSDVSISIDSSFDDSKDEEQMPKDTVVSFLACPDNIIHPSVFYDAIERKAVQNNTKPVFNDLHNADYDFSPIYEYVANDISYADIAYINQETLIGGTSGKIIGYPCFNSPNAVADTVIDLGFDVVNVAHNHMLDSGNTKYLENCNSVFENEGLEVIGYYPDKESTENITVIESKGIKVAFLAYTYGTNGIRLPSKSEFIIPYLNEELVTKQVKIAKEISDIVIVSCHWGYEDTFNPNSEQKKYAELMTELEVDVVLGMHPHVIQPMEWKTASSGHKTLVVYSLGNFVSGMVAGKNMLAGMLSINIVRDAETAEVYIDTPLFVPIVTHYVKKTRVASNDTGYRDFKIYPLIDYTEELASEHGVRRYESSHGTTLVGGKFSVESLNTTLKKYIPDEFLPIEFKND